MKTTVHIGLLFFVAALFTTRGLTQDQPYDFNLNPMPGNGWSPWGGHWNYGSNAYPMPYADFFLDLTNNKLDYYVQASGGAGYRGDLIKVYVSRVGSTYNATIRWHLTMVRIGRGQSISNAYTRTIERAYTYPNLADATAGINAVRAALNAQYPPMPFDRNNTPYQSIDPDTGWPVNMYGSQELSAEVRATAWDQLAIAGTPNISRNYVGAGEQYHDGNYANQLISGSVPINFAFYPARQFTIERWTFQRTSGNDNRLELQSMHVLNSPPLNFGPPQTQVKVRVAGGFGWEGVTEAYPTIDAATSPAQVGFTGDAIEVKIDGIDAQGRISKVGYTWNGAEVLRDLTVIAAEATEEFSTPTPLRPGETITVAGRTVLGADGNADSADTAVIHVHTLVPVIPDATVPQIGGLPGVTTGSATSPWEIISDFHHLFGQTESTTDYGLEFNQHRYVAQKWEWRNHANVIIRNPSDIRYTQPKEVISQPDAPAVAHYDGPVFQRDLTQWTPGQKPVAPVAVIPPVIEINAGGVLPTAVASLVWENPWSPSVRPDDWSDWPIYHSGEMRRAQSIVRPAGRSTLTLTRSEDGATWTQPLTSGTILPAGTWRCSATYTAVSGEPYVDATASFTVSVRPMLDVSAQNASLEFSGDGGQTWAPWTAQHQAYQKSDNSWVILDGQNETPMPLLVMRATPAPTYDWGTSWDSVGSIWFYSRSNGDLDTDANFWLQAESAINPNVIQIPRAINRTVLRAIGQRAAPRITAVSVEDVANRSSSVGMNSPWVFLARSGVRFSVTGQSRESGVDAFEVQALPPGMDATVEANWLPLNQVTVPNPSRPRALLQSSVTAKLGRTQADEGGTGPGAAFIPSAAFVNLAGVPPNATTWQIRARCRSIVGTLSDWFVYQVNVMLPLRAEVITSQNMPPATPLGAAQWFNPSQQSAQAIYLWIP